MILNITSNFITIWFRRTIIKDLGNALKIECQMSFSNNLDASRNHFVFQRIVLGIAVLLRLSKILSGFYMLLFSFVPGKKTSKIERTRMIQTENGQKNSKCINRCVDVWVNSNEVIQKTNSIVILIYFASRNFLFQEITLICSFGRTIPMEYSNYRHLHIFSIN